ncbi:MAG: efflux RND transporter periplasmic adaptor subunit [Chitinophagaceae bacterium]|nr:efflux RND transporter periplasmic adaptor subunit [Chitinophagaceae bacterium]
MKTQKIIGIIVAGMLLSEGCNKTENTVEEKKKILLKYKQEYSELGGKIKKIEKEIQDIYSKTGENIQENITLVTTLKLSTKEFHHEIEMRGNVESRNNVIISAETLAKTINIFVKEGQWVNEGQKLIQLDGSILENSLNEIKNNLEMARTMFEKQSALWEKKIGTELQYLQAKTNKEGLENRLATVESQMLQTSIRAPFNGKIDHIFAKNGEIVSPGIPLIRIVSPTNMSIKVDVSESYTGKFHDGEPVKIYFSEQNKTIKSSISSVQQVINPESRSFKIDINLPQAPFSILPNQTALVYLIDYLNKKAITIPTRLIQRDLSGYYIYKISKTETKTTAQKISITLGASFDGETEILTGLQDNDQIIDKGYRDVLDNLEVKVVEQ